MFTRSAGFPAIKTLDSYEFGFATGVDRGRTGSLATVETYTTLRDATE